MSVSRPGYEYLAAYQLGLVIQELTDKFCQNFLIYPTDPKLPKRPNYRQVEQMEQAARSNPQNIAEGHTQPSLKGYIKLAGIAEGSNEELQKDYLRFLQKNDYAVWSADHPKIREFRTFRVRWVGKQTLNTPRLPTDPEEAANMLYSFCKMEGVLLHGLVKSLLKKHEREGGFTEKLYRARTARRGY